MFPKTAQLFLLVLRVNTHRRKEVAWRTWKYTEKSHKTQTSQTPPKASSSWPHLRNSLLSAKFSTVFQSWRVPDPKLNASFSFPARKSASCEQLWLCAGVMEAPSSTELPHAVCLGRALLQGNLVPTRPASLGLLWVPATMAFSERWRSYKNTFLTGTCTHRDSKINFILYQHVGTYSPTSNQDCILMMQELIVLST